MIMLFDQDYATEAYGKQQRREGREEGRILDRIEVYREDGLDEETISAKIMEKFNLTKTDAAAYLAEAAVAYTP